MKSLVTIALVAIMGVVLATTFFRAPKVSPMPIVDKDISRVEISQEELHARVGQMIMVGFRGTEVSKEFAAQLARYNVGGVILFDRDVPTKSFPRNIIDRDQVQKLTAELQAVSPTPLFVAVDAEGGSVNRLASRYGFFDMPSAAELGQGSPDETFVAAEQLAKQLSEIGINVNFAPVVDVNVNPSNPIIGKIGRAFSSDPEQVRLHARQFISAQYRNNVISVLKHFPGHGSSENDSHQGVVDITDTYQPYELDPYRSLIGESGVDAVMVAHVFNADIDSEHPASLSSVFVNEMLREELGFDGVVFSDDLQMKAITDQYGFSEAVVLAIMAGTDVVVVGNNMGTYDANVVAVMHEAILQAVRDGHISSDQIIRASDRIFELKRRYGIIK